MWVRNWRVVRARGGTCVIDSVNESTAHAWLRHRHRALCHRTTIRSSPYPRSFGEVTVRSFTDVDATPHEWHTAADGSAVTACTTRVLSGSRSTRSTRTPANPNNFVVASVTAPWSFFLV
jgi:hypothetical protein